MKIPTIGKDKIPVFGIGTWKMGGTFGFGLTKFGGSNTQDLDAIKAALEMGVTHIDTAEMYAQGEAERLVGQAIKGRDRNSLWITSKVGPHNLDYNSVISSCKGSLVRLGTDYLDLYLVHWPNPLIPIKQTMAAMDYLVQQGLIRMFGVSNFSLKQFIEAQGYAQNKIVTNQVHYSLLHRDPEEELLDYFVKNDVIITAYTPLEFGELGRRGYNPILDKLSDKYQKTPAQISLNYLISQPNTIVIPKASKIEHLEDNLGCLGWELLPEDIKQLQEIFN